MKTLCYADRAGVVNGLLSEKNPDLSAYDFTGDTNGLSEMLFESRICEYMIERDEYGREKKRLFSYLMRPTIDGRGIGGYEYEYDNDCRLIRCAYLSANGRFDWNDAMYRACTVAGLGTGVLHICCRDGRNNPTVDKKNGLIQFRECLDGFGNVTNRVFLDEQGKVAWRIKTKESKEVSAIQNFIFENGQRVLETAAAPDGKPLVSYKWEYDAKGRRKRRYMFDAVGKLTSDENGASILDFEKTSFDTVCVQVCRDVDGNVCHDAHGVARYEYSYDTEGNCIESRLYDEIGCLVIGDEGWAIMRKQYKGGRLIATEYYDAATNCVPVGEIGVPCVRQDFDTPGEIHVRYYRTAECAEPVVSASGSGGYNLVLDDRGRVKCMQLVDCRGEVSSSNKDNFAIMKIEYFEKLHRYPRFGKFCDDSVCFEMRRSAFMEDGITPALWLQNMGNPVSRTFKDNRGLEVLSCSCNYDLSFTNMPSEGLIAPVMQSIYNERGILSECRYLDGDGRPSKSVFGFGCRYEYNQHQQEICCIPLDEHLKPDMDRRYARREYDEQGRILACAEWRGGVRTVGEDGCHNQRYQRDVLGRIVRRTALDLQSNVMWSISSDFDRVGNETNRCYYGNNNFPTRGITGYFRQAVSYDRLHRKTRITLYDTNGIDRISGNSEFLYEYYGCTKRLSTQQRSAVLGFANNFKGISKFRIKYANTLRNEEIEREYFDSAGNVVPAATVVVIESVCGFPDGTPCGLDVQPFDTICYINKEGEFMGPVLSEYKTDEFVRGRKRIEVMNAIAATGGRFVVARKRDDQWSFVDYPHSNTLSCAESAGVSLSEFVIPDSEVRRIMRCRPQILP